MPQIIHPHPTGIALATQHALQHAAQYANRSHHGAVIMCIPCNKIIAACSNNNKMHAETECLNSFIHHTPSKQTFVKKKKCLLRDLHYSYEIQLYGKSYSSNFFVQTLSSLSNSFEK